MHSKQSLFLNSALKQYRKDGIHKQMNKLEELVSCPNVLLELGDFYRSSVKQLL